MMHKRGDALFLAGIFALSFLFCSLALTGGYRWCEGLFYDKMAAAVSVSEGEAGIMKALKDTQSCDLKAGREILGRYGYEGPLPVKGLYAFVFWVSLLFAGGSTSLVFLYVFWGRISLKRRAEGLSEYLRQVEEGEYSLSIQKRQDALSNLEDEIYKTVLALRESRERLGQEKKKLADNLADISHQFKTPLTSISVLSELLLRHVSRTEDAALVHRIEGQAERLSDLTLALLTLSRADAGVLSFELREVPVSELIECSLEDVHPLLEKKSQRAEILGEEELLEGLCLSCDLGWMRQALGNLLKNASEHGPGQSTITIRVWDNPVFTGIAVEDQGPGFSPGDLRRLFDRFYKGEASRFKDSTGIGLSLAKTLIEGQGGEIRAENRREGGARFLVKFYKT